MWRTLNVRLPVGMVGLALAAAVVTGYLGWSGARDGLAEAAEERLAFAADARGRMLQMVFDKVRTDLGIAAQSSTVAGNLPELTANIAPDDATLTETLHYFAAAATAGERAALDGKGLTNMYGFRHAKPHGELKAIRDSAGYADVYLLGPDGRIVYSVTKGADFALTIDDPNVAGTGLARVYERLASEKAASAFEGFAAYPVAGTAPSAFYGKPVLDTKMPGAEAPVVGYVVFRFEPGLLDRVMSPRDGLGETGQVFALSEDGLLASNPPLLGLPAGAPGGDVWEAVGQGAGKGIASTLSNGVLDQLAYTRVEGFDHTWTVVAMQAVSENLSAVSAITTRMLWASVVILLGTLALGFLAARSVTGPIIRLTGSLGDIASGRSDTEIPGATRRDEIGAIARAVDRIREVTRAEAVSRSESEIAERQQREIERRRMTEALARDFEEHVGTVVGKLAGAAVDLERAADDMVTVAEQARDRSGKVSSASHAASNSVQLVAAATDELFASLSEVSSLIRRSGDIASEADRHAQSTTTIVSSLSEAASRIGTVVDIIQSIAEQTNLLALNATIEAARAGEAGRGFAVVAGEVKNLAGQTAKATEEIGAQISAMRESTRTAVDAISHIRGVVGEIGTAVGSVIVAVEEQSKATDEIARSAQTAAAGTGTVTTNITDVQSAVGQTDEAAAKVALQARTLGRDAAELKAGLNRFIEQILAA